MTEPGNYWVEATDESSGCTINAETEIIKSTNSSSEEDVYICEGETKTICSDFLTGDIVWSNGDDTYCINVDEFGDYTFNQTTEYGCVIEKTFHVKPYILNIDVDDAGACDFSSLQKQVYNLQATYGFSDYNWSVTSYDVNNNIIDNQIPFTGISFNLDYNGTQVHYAEVSLTAISPSGCEVEATTTVYVYDGVWFGGEQNFPDLEAQDWVDVNYIFFTDIELSDLHTHLIKNSHIEFAPGYGITVKNKNTRLYIQHSSITNLFCQDDIWNGILAKGNASAPHQYTDQPTINIQNGSEISNAKTAVKSIDGAIIRTGTTTFKNNINSIWFDAYTGQLTANTSQITNNTFIVNSEVEILQNFDFQEFVHIFRFPSMKLYSNDFFNDYYELDIADRGIGVNSNKVISLILDYGNKFRRLKRAVNVTSSYNLTVKGNYFEDNYQGAFFFSNKNLVAKNNRFNDHLLTPTTDAFQMTVGACTAPKIEYNRFSNGVVGLLLLKGNFNDFQIYKNNFTGFNMYSSNLNGHPTALLNRAKNGTFPAFGASVGAEVKCNTFNDYDYAIAITYGTLKREQGYDGGDDTRAPAGNTFVDDGNMPDGRFFVEIGLQTGYEYFRHNAVNFNPEFDIPLSWVNVTNTGAIFDANSISGSCPTVLDFSFGTLTPSLSITTDSVNIINTSISTKEDDLLTKVDKGNTELLLSDIAIANDANYTDLVQELQEVDSYLSDASAIEFMDKTTNRPVAKAIGLIANSPLPSKAKAKIDNLNMDENLKNYIKAHQNGLSKREKEEKEIHKLKLRKSNLLRTAVQMAHRDSTGLLYNEVINLLLDQSDWEQREMAYHMLKFNKREMEASALLLELEQDIALLDEDKQYQMEDYLQLLNIEANLDTLSDSLRIQSILQNQIFLEELKNGNLTEASTKAELLLKEANLLDDVLHIQLPNPKNANRSAVQYTSESKKYNFSETMDVIDVYPNPADDKLTVEYIMFNGMSANSIGIYDINGKLLQTHAISKTMDIVNINVSSLSSGTYIVAFGKDGINSHSTKFIVK